MNVFNRNAFECYDLDELQQWVSDLQGLLATQREQNRTLRKQNELLYSVCEQQDQRNDSLEAKGRQLKEAIAKHESGQAHHYDLRHN